MPRIRNPEFYEAIKPFTIYVFVGQIGDECYVWKTKNNDLKAVFEMHYLMRIARTKKLFEEGRRENKVPEMYVLETIEATEAEAFKHCVAWTKYFMEHGFESLNHEIHQGYTESLSSETQVIYNRIKDLFLSEILIEENQKFADYGTVRKKKEVMKRPQITFLISQEEYEIIKEKAESINLTPGAYAKRMTLDGEIRHENYEFLSEYKDSLRMIERRLKGILMTIYETGKYYPADLENIQKLCDEAKEHHVDAMTVFNKRRYGKRTRRK